MSLFYRLWPFDPRYNFRIPPLVMASQKSNDWRSSFYKTDKTRSDFNLNFSKIHDVINCIISWLYILMAIYVNTCTEYVQYRICLTSMKDNGWNYRTFCSGKKCRTVRRRSGHVRLSIVSISGRSRSERPLPQSGTIRGFPDYPIVGKSRI